MEELKNEKWFWAEYEEADRWNGPFDTEILAALANGESECWTGKGEPLDPAFWLEDCQSLIANAEDNNPEVCPVDRPWEEVWSMKRGRLEVSQRVHEGDVYPVA